MGDEPLLGGTSLGPKLGTSVGWGGLEKFLPDGGPPVYPPWKKNPPELLAGKKPLFRVGKICVIKMLLLPQLLSLFLVLCKLKFPRNFLRILIRYFIDSFGMGEETGSRVVLWLACFFHVDMSIYFDLDIDMHVDIIRVSKSKETLTEKL